MKLSFSRKDNISSLHSPASSLLVLFILLLCISNISFAESGGPLTLYTSNYPLTYFAERIGGEHVNVVFPAPPDIDPAFWTPNSKTVREYQKADLIILNGAGYEKWARKVSIPMLKTVDTSKGFRDNLIHIDTNVTHSHGPGGDHSHGGTAFTTWLDFSQALQQAEAIYKALIRKLPKHTDELTRNFEQLKKDLLQLDAQMKQLSAKQNGLPLVASHPVYQYMARRYNLNLKMVMWEPDADPGEREWQGLKELLKEHPAKWMIWEGKPLPGSKQRLLDMGIKSQVFSPCFNRPEKGDFLSVMQQNVENLLSAFGHSLEAKLINCTDPRPQVCTMNYNPVCVQFETGGSKTYSNWCTACSDINVVAYRDGECN